ncbi:MAG: hypothetical protein NTX22_16795 [Ignavibacteriales bacterium]|nr:hypothetical protein [Ignavibacteriales bacterium]
MISSNKLFVASAVIFLTIVSNCFAQDYPKYGEVIKLHLSSAPFPHPNRAEGHTYDNKLYPADKHYSDSTVLIFIPKGFQPKGPTDFIIYFHGWYNNIDSACKQFNITEQFSASNKNAILVFPEGPKDAPDSFGGKLEDENGFANLMKEIVENLVIQKKIKEQEIGNIILAGHSGAYHAISFMLLRGGLTEKIKEVFLFDALYGQTEKYVYWLTKYNGKLINIYTKDGGTKWESENLIEDLKGWGIPFIAKDEVEITADELKNNKLIFLYSQLGHNDVISKNKNWMKFLQSSCFSDLK